MIPTTTGTHRGMEGEHLGTGIVGSELELVVVVSVSGAAVVMATGGLGRLLILVKMKGLDYNKDKIVRIFFLLSQVMWRSKILNKQDIMK